MGCTGVLYSKGSLIVEDTLRGGHLMSPVIRSIPSFFLVECSILPYPTLPYPTLPHPIRSDPIVSHPVLEMIMYERHFSWQNLSGDCDTAS